MPIPSPILDDRSYQQLRDELIDRIPVYAPEWTDHNPSDPGITLIELFAFLGENLLFRFNQIPDATKLAFLRMLQAPLRPAEPARALVRFRTDLPEGELVSRGAVLKAGAVPFEVSTETHAWPVSGIGAGRLATEVEVDSDHVENVIQARGGLEDEEEPVFYETALVPADPTAPDARAIDFRRTVDGVVWVAVLYEGDGDVDAVKAELAGGILNVGFELDPDVGSWEDILPCPGEGAEPTRRSMRWEISGPARADGAPTYRALKLEGDTTAGLENSGVVRLRLPEAPHELTTPEVDDLDLLGVGDRPPFLEDTELGDKVLFWIRGFRSDGTRPGSVIWIDVNAAHARQARGTPSRVFVGTGDGDADQTLQVPSQYRPVLPDSMRLEVERADGSYEAWTEVRGFEASAEDAQHFALDSESGTVRFGNGVRGAAPQIGRRVRARWRYGGGRAGNVAARAINKLESGLAKVENPLPARGGLDTESMEAALDRIPGELRRRDRAVTSGDFRELAMLCAPDAVARAECLPRFDPHHTDVEAAGVVSVMIWPKEDAEHPDAPMPDRRLIERVCRCLDAKRLVTTELYVVGPRYRRVAVSLGVRTKAGYGTQEVHQWVELVVRQYLAPVPPYGPDGSGWPLGRPVRAAELEAAALQVEGVEYVTRVYVVDADDPPAAPTDELEACRYGQLVELAPWEVVEVVGEVAVVDGDEPPLPLADAPVPGPPGAH